MILLVALIVTVTSVAMFTLLDKPGMQTQPAVSSRAAPKTSAVGNSASSYPGFSTAVTSEKVNVRSDVGTDQDIVCSVPADTRLELTGRANPDNTWVQVRTSDGKSGWCCRAFLDVDHLDAVTVQVPADTVNPLSIRVSLASQKVTVLDADGKTVRTFICSAGQRGSETPKGTFAIGGRGKAFYSKSSQEGGYYWTRIYGDYLFHSIPFDGNYKVIPAEASKLGTAASHGCVRLAFDDAKWIYEHIPDGTKVVIQ